MHRRRTGGMILAGIGAIVLAALLVLGSLRHPVDAVEETTPVEYVAIALALVCLTVGAALVLATYVAEADVGGDSG